MEEPEGGETGGGDVQVGGDTTMYDDIDDVDDFDPAKFQIEEGMVAEVMRRLEEEINQPPSSSSSSSCGGGDSGGFHQYQAAAPNSLPSSSSLSGAPFVTINGNEESCGPSFSDSASTVMASIDTRGVPQFVPLRGASPAPPKAASAEAIWPWSPEPGVDATFGEPGTADGAAAADFCVEDMGVAGDDGWLARVLAGAGLEGDGEMLGG